jgi:hypothetical protein
MDIVFLRRLVIIISVVGVLLLLMYTHYYSPKTFSVYEFIHLQDTDNYLEKTVSLFGTVRDPIIKQNHLFFNICSGSTCVLCVVFNYNDLQKNLVFNNKKIKVSGKHTIFNNKKEIIVQRLDHVNT